jgi:hypothetical protein
MAFSMTSDATPKVTTRRLITMGLLTIWFPYIFVWLIQKPTYPRAFRYWLTVGATIWTSSAILFFVINIAGLNPRG